MSIFDAWCDESKNEVNGHRLTVLRMDDDRRAIGVEAVASELPQHYMSASRYADILTKLGKPAAAQCLKDKLPQTKSIRSGDLGEILAISYIEQKTIWNQTIKKLRWKDHREMAMRGDDLIAVGFEDGEIQFLKGEAKSRAKLSSTPLREARKTLGKNNGRPSPHALAFFSARLVEEGREDIADRIDAAQYQDSIPLSRISQMMFTFSGNSPESLLKTDLADYDGDFDQFSVGLQVDPHQGFIKEVFETVINDGDT